MILFALAGYAAYKFFDIEMAVPGAVLIGLLVAPLVPAKTACSISPPEADASTSTTSGDQTS